MGSLLLFLTLTFLEVAWGDVSTFPPVNVPRQADELPQFPPEVETRNAADLPPFKFPSRKVVDLPLDTRTRAAVPIYTMSMKLDNFNNADTRRFNMRYSMNSAYFNATAGGPLFVFIGGESNMENVLGYLYTGVFFDTAKANKALMVANEHRFYGLSIPNMDLSAPSIKYLQVNQSLADLAAFITNLKKTYPKINKVVVMGGSYPGSLAAWMRLKYPSLVTAAVSFSGIANIQVDNYGYNEVVTTAVRNHSVTCYNTILNGTTYLRALLQNGYQSWVQSYFNLSYSLVPEVNQQNFFNTITYYIGDIVQYDKQNPSTIATMCGNFSKNSNLYPDYHRFIMVMRNVFKTGMFVQGSDANAGYSWTYQVCSELGNFVTTDSNNQFYGPTVPLDFWTNYCAARYLNSANANGVFNGNCYLTNYTMGLDKATNIIYTIGETDPWRAVGMLKSPNSLSPVLFVPKSSHCAVLTPASSVNSPELTAARKTVQSTITAWIK